MKEKNKSDEFTKLNDFFSYGTTAETAHIHMPSRIDELIKEKGLQYTIEHLNESLYDALNKLVQIAEKNPEIKKVFAVSPLLSAPMFRERLEVLGFKTEQASPRFERIFSNSKNLKQDSIPITRLKKVLEIEDLTREEMDKHGPMWHDKILYYKYEALKKMGIIGYYDIPLDKIIEMGKKNYNYRHGIPLKTKAEMEEEFDRRNGQAKKDDELEL